MAIPYLIVSCSTTISYRLVSHPIAQSVYHNIVDKSIDLLSKHNSYLIPSAHIRHVSGIDFPFNSNLYFEVQRWIILLLPLFRLLVSSFRLESFLIFSQNESSSCLSLHPSLTIFRESFRSWNISTHSLSPSSFGSKLSC